MHHLSGAAVVAVGLAVLATGCGGDDDGGDEPAAAEAPEAASDTSASDAAAAPDACPLTSEEVSAALGEEMVQPDAALCAFEPAELPDTGPFIDYRPSSTAAMEAFASGGSEPVDGVGDEALFDETFGNLAVRQGDTAFEIQLNEYDGDVQATAVELAQVVLDGG